MNYFSLKSTQSSFLFHSIPASVCSRLRHCNWYKRKCAYLYGEQINQLQLGMALDSRTLIIYNLISAPEKMVSRKPGWEGRLSPYEKNKNGPFFDFGGPVFPLFGVVWNWLHKKNGLLGEKGRQKFPRAHFHLKKPIFGIYSQGGFGVRVGLNKTII